MKMSAITDALVAEYLKLDYTTMTTAEKTALTTLIGIAKAFIKGQTGLEDISPEDEVVGTGDGEETEFTLAWHPVTAASQTIYVDGVAKAETTDYTLVDDTGVITFLTAPEAEITASYSAVPSDGFEDFVIAVYVLVQDMYDNRSMYVDKTNINRTIEAILAMHSINLL